LVKGKSELIQELHRLEYDLDEIRKIFKVEQTAKYLVYCEKVSDGY